MVNVFHLSHAGFTGAFALLITERDVSSMDSVRRRSGGL